MEMFSTVMSPQEREMGRWISQNGGKEAVLKSEDKCAEMIKFEAALATDSPAGHADKGRLVSGEEAKKNEAKAIAALRKEYREDIQGIIQENMEGFSKRFEMGLDDLGKELGNKIQHQGDRLIKYLRGGPHQRIKDKVFTSRGVFYTTHSHCQMIFHVWKDQVSGNLFGSIYFLILLRDGEGVRRRDRWSSRCAITLSSGSSTANCPQCQKDWSENVQSLQCRNKKKKTTTTMIPRRISVFRCPTVG
jgi:hypothetical protein